ncbi:MAG: prolyl oligopeptidase family serine peptidase [Gemmatimonadaceae bacterium]
MIRASRLLLGAFVLSVHSIQVGAQEGRTTAEPRPAPRVLDPGDLAGWKSIRSTAWSLDGRIFAYQLTPNEGDAEVVVKTVADGKETRYPIGEPPAGFGGGGGAGAALGISGDAKWVAFLKYPLAKDAKRLRKDRRPIQSSVMIVDLATGKTREFERVRRFAFDGEKPTIVALHRYSDAAPPAAAPPGGTPPGPGGPSAAPATSQAADLLIVKLAGPQVTHVGDVSEFAFDEQGEYLAWTIDTRDRFGSAVHLRNNKTETTQVLDSERAVYRRLTWADSGTSLAVLRGVPDSAAADTNYSVVAWKDVTQPAATYTPSDASGMPGGMRISAERAPRWSWDRSAVYLGIAARRVAAPGEKSSPDVKAVAGTPGAIAGGGGSARSGDDEALPTLIIWHGDDSRLQSQQQVEETRDKAFNYLAAYRVTEQKLVRLGNDSLRDVVLTGRDRHAYAFDVRAYERLGNIDGRRYRDVYAIDTRTGEARVLAKKLLGVGFGGGGMVSAPDGSRLLYWNDGNYHVYDLATSTSRNLTAGAPVSFINKENDHNIDRPPTPVLGWAKDGESVLISDNWDVWRVPVRTGTAVNLTMIGRVQGTRFQRRIVVDPRDRGIDLTKPLYFATYGERSKKSGVARVDAAKPGAATLLIDDAQFFASRARDADAWFFTRQTFTQYPDYWTSDGTFKNARQLSDAASQQKDIAWSAGARLIDYVSDKGDSLQGALFLPAGYQPGKKYPTVVYIYEKLSQGLHAYAVPNETRAFNPSVYTSRGYAVLMPDIVYRVNDPGMSAVWCVVPAVKAAIATGIVDSANVGLHGHSWGGYQTAFLVTQTNVFKSAIAGAALTDMVSMYSSVYWNTGSANQPIFESSQGRFAGNFIDNYDAYIRNSPAFHAKNVKTPLLLLHNERDGAVDFNQGITYYNTLRGLGKDVLLLQYVGENHGLAQPENQKDYTIRMKEYFDTYLTGKPAPEWLKNGIPRLQMQEHLKSRQKKVAS